MMGINIHIVNRLRCSTLTSVTTNDCVVRSHTVYGQFMLVL